jgi:hypothetical protein
MTARRLLPLVLLLLLPASAHADGSPIVSQSAGPKGIVEASGSARLAALPTPRGTVLTRSQIHGGRVLRAAVLKGFFGIPVVAYDGTSGGLSADRSTLVLTSPFAHRHSTFAVVDARRFELRRTIKLRGVWGFDALSPDASTLYLIRTSLRNPSRYAVRAYDLRAGRLLPEPVVDPSEPDEPMRGVPVTRVTGPGGRWEYTLYTGGEHPFVHALDTVRRESVCIDLPERIARARWIWRARLALRGGSVKVLHGEQVAASAPLRPQEASAGGGPPWAAAGLALAGLMVAVGVRRAARRGRAAPPLG